MQVGTKDCKDQYCPRSPVSSTAIGISDVNWVISTAVSEGVSLKYQNKLVMVGNSFELRSHTPEP